MADGYANPYAPAPPGFDEDFFLNSDPDAGFTKYLEKMLGITGNNPMASFARNSQNRVYNQYKSVAAQNPNMGFWDYLRQNKPDLGAEFNAQSPEQRGDYSSRILTPRARWTV